MNLNLFAIGGLYLCIMCFSFVTFLLIYGKTKLHRVWAWFNFAVGWWGLGAFFTGISPDPKTAFLAWKFANAGVIFIAASHLHLIYVFCNIQKKYFIIAAYIWAALFSVINIVNFHFMKNIHLIFSSFYYGRADTLYHFFIITWSMIVGWSLYELFLYYRKSTGITRRQITYFFVGTVIGFSAGWTNFLPTLDIKIYPFGNFTIPFYTILVTYAVIKYHLMDVRVAITRTGLFLLLYIVLLGIPFYVGYSTQLWIIAALLLAVFASIGPFIYRYLRIKTEAVIFQKSRQYQSILRAASEELLSIKDRNVLLDRLCHLVCDNVNPAFGAIYLIENNNFSLKDSEPADLPLAPSFSVNHPIVENLVGRDGVVYDVDLEGTVIPLAVAVGQRDNIKGVFFLGEKKNKEMYSHEDVQAFKTLLNQVSLALENMQHIEEVITEHKEKERLKREMEMAKQIQQSLLPEASPAGMEGVTIEGLLVPAQEVAGDYYDFIPYSSQRVGVVVADVSGKGMDAGMVMSMTKSTLFTLSQQDTTPRDLVLNLNKMLCAQLKQQKFISLIYAEYIADKDTFVWSGAGQEHILLCRGSGPGAEIEIIKTGGIVLGMIKDIDNIITQNSLTLKKGERLILYSDGAIDARDPAGERFTLERLVDTIKTAPDLPARGFLTYIKDRIQDFIKDTPQYDDITLVMIGKE